MPGLRLLLRLAPFMVGAVAVGVWLRRLGAGRKALPAGPRVRELTPGAAPEVPVGAAQEALVGATSEAPVGAPAAAPVGEADYALNRERAESGGHAEPARRFQREPIDIVTVVDDLLQAGR